MSDGFGGNGQPPGSDDEDDEPEHPVFRRLRQLWLWHRVAFAIAAFTAGRWIVLALVGSLRGDLPPAELTFVVVELTMLAALALGLAGFVRLAPWSIPLLLAALAVCTFPVARQSMATGTTMLGDGRFPVALSLTQLKVPSLGLDLLAPALAVWLWLIRPLHRRVRHESPLGAATLRLKLASLAVGALAFLAGALPIGLYLAQLEDRTAVTAGAAEGTVAARVVRNGELRAVTCASSSSLLRGPLFRPFYFVVFVGPTAGEPPRTVGGARRVDAGDGAVTSAGAADATPSQQTPRTPEELCRGIAVDVRVRTETRPPWPFALF